MCSETDMSIRRELALFLSAARRASQLSISEVADRARDVSETNIESYEDGSVAVPADHLYTLIAIYNVPLFALYEIQSRVRKLKSTEP